MPVSSSLKAALYESLSSSSGFMLNLLVTHGAPIDYFPIEVIHTNNYLGPVISMTLMELRVPIDLNCLSLETTQAFESLFMAFFWPYSNSKFWLCALHYPFQF